ncbi:hypothetical protein EW146_g8195 [Bondarzewia mesenterica]|uniref:Helicase ATP-binding domain-containing protein n=1 Tax=Bondarzewia mesenterica TaxID=1095465 RepID=A0A4S4LGE0_9AGAM|nr:hypothetical protein EW146_g8195 [Bondarzewia mesenterica]
MNSSAGSSNPDARRNRKRKTNGPAVNEGNAKKRRTPAKGKEKAKQADRVDEEWPKYFQDLFKIFKALNTVLAFCSSRKHLAITFPVVRKSVENILKEPLELAKVAELKALLPDVVKFAYTPKDEIRVNATQQQREPSPDFGKFMQPEPSTSDGQEHVLVLEFHDNVRGTRGNSYMFTLPPSMTPAQVKKLIEKRNERFALAINELLQATENSSDPVALLKAAAHDHIPVDPYVKAAATFGEPMSMVIPNSENRSSVDEIITEIQQAEWYKNQIVERRVSEAKEGQIGELDPPLSETIHQAFRDSRKITSLYTHQVAAIQALAQSKDVIVSTSTASGKSVIYQAPVLRFLEEDSAATAIFVYPTKALAQDQKAALEQLLCSCPGLDHITVATYDGDTPQELRRDIRETASIILTNFDMIHTSILPHEDLWRRFLKNLKLVAVDELHYYSDLFGSHVALIMRRLRRICAAVGNRRTRFVSCSATISKPKQHMKSIFGLQDVEAITEDGAPSGRKEFLIWECPLIDQMDPNMGRRGPLTEATGLMRYLMKRGIRVILFCKVRKSCELAMKTIRAELSAEGRYDILSRVMSYRGGYSQEDRRKIEHEAFFGNLLGIIATNALELGVDIGVLDAVIMLGFPVSLASFRQQIGRAGRRARDALAVLVADDLPIDRHYVNNPQELFDKDMDDLLVDLDSKWIVESHLQCAAYEMPVSLEDEKWFGPWTKELCETKLVKDKEGWYHTHPKSLPFPAKNISLRGAEEEKYDVIDITNLRSEGGVARILEEVEISRALFELYEGAIFIHQGLPFLVKEISHDSKRANVIRTDVNWTTSPRDFTDVDAVQTHRIREIRQSPRRAFYGRVDVSTTVFGFFKTRGHIILDTVDVDMPPYERTTMGMWIDVSKDTLELMKEKGMNPAEAIHSAQHAFLNRSPMPSELRTECKAPEKEYKATGTERKRPARLIFYDIPGKGGSIAANAFDHASEILHRAHETVESCNCQLDTGCANCIASPYCSEKNIVASKLGASIVLKDILNIPIDANVIPFQFTTTDEEHQTIVAASEVRRQEGVEVEKDDS